MRVAIALVAVLASGCAESAWDVSHAGDESLFLERSQELLPWASEQELLDQAERTCDELVATDGHPDWMLDSMMESGELDRDEEERIGKFIGYMVVYGCPEYVDSLTRYQ